MARLNSRGFTFVEILVTLALFGILFIPVMQLFSNALEGTENSRSLITAVSLARWEMERTRNLGFMTRVLKDQGNVIYPPMNEPPLELNKQKWRIHRTLKAGSDPVEVEVAVYHEGEKTPVTKLMTLITDMSWSKEKQVIPEKIGPPK